MSAYLAAAFEILKDFPAGLPANEIWSKAMSRRLIKTRRPTLGALVESLSVR